MTLPFSQVVAVARVAGNQAGKLPLPLFTAALASAHDGPDTALLLARLFHGDAVSTATARELELEIAALAPDARSLIGVVARALSHAQLAPIVHRALNGIGFAMGAVFGAIVPGAVTVDATILQACRETHWTSHRLVETERGEELGRRIARALGVAIQGETAAASAKKLVALDPELAATDARIRTIEQSIRNTLPRL